MKPAIMSRLASAPLRRKLIVAGAAGAVIATLLSRPGLNIISSNAEREFASRKGRVTERGAWAAYLSRHPGAWATPKTMDKISELGETYLGNLPPEKRLEMAIGIIASHARHPEKTERLRKEIAKAENRLSALEAEREQFLKSHPERASDSLEHTGDFRKMEGIRNSLKEMHQELLIHYGFLVYCNGLAKGEKAGKK